MTKITFSTNWNNKLDCKAFTTLRLRNDSKYVPGQTYSIYHKDSYWGKAVIRSISHFYLKDLNNFIAYLDTGYSKEECAAIIQKMYPKVDFANKQLSLILLVYDQEAMSTLEEKLKRNPGFQLGLLLGQHTNG